MIRTYTFTIDVDEVALHGSEDNASAVFKTSNERLFEIISLSENEREARYEATNEKYFNTVNFTLKLLEANALSGNELLFLLNLGLSAEAKMEELLDRVNPMARMMDAMEDKDSKQT